MDLRRDGLTERVGGAVVDLQPHLRTAHGCGHLEAQLGIALGARGTPAFFVNGRFLSGAQPLANFSALIDEELVKANLDLEGCDAVVHAAAAVSVTKAGGDDAFDGNVVGARTVLGQACERGLDPVVFVSSLTAILDPRRPEATTGDSPTAARLLATADDAMYAVKRNRAGSR